MIRPTYLGPDDPRIAAAPRELDSRISDGIYVQLLWYPHDGQVSVLVIDSKTGEIFELDVRYGQPPPTRRLPPSLRLRRRTPQREAPRGAVHLLTGSFRRLRLARSSSSLAVFGRLHTSPCGRPIGVEREGSARCAGRVVGQLSRRAR